MVSLVSSVGVFPAVYLLRTGTFVIREPVVFDLCMIAIIKLEQRHDVLT